MFHGKCATSCLIGASVFAEICWMAEGWALGNDSVLAEGLNCHSPSPWEKLTVMHNTPIMNSTLRCCIIFMGRSLREEPMSKKSSKIHHLQFVYRQRCILAVLQRDACTIFLDKICRNTAPDCTYSLNMMTVWQLHFLYSWFRATITTLHTYILTYWLTDSLTTHHSITHSPT